MIPLGFTDVRRERPAAEAFCPVCGKMRWHRVQMVEHGFFVLTLALGPVAVRRYEFTCKECRAVRASESPGELQAAPPPQDREAFLLEQLAVLSAQLDHEHECPSFSPWGKRLLIATIALFTVTIVVGFGGRLFDLHLVESSALAQLVLVTGVPMIAAGIYAALSAKPWFLSHRLAPQVRRALAPIEPTLAELDDALATLREGDYRIATEFDGARLYGWLQER